MGMSLLASFILLLSFGCGKNEGSNDKSEPIEQELTLNGNIWFEKPTYQSSSFKRLLMDRSLFVEMEDPLTLSIFDREWLVRKEESKDDRVILSFVDNNDFNDRLVNEDQTQIPVTMNQHSSAYQVPVEIKDFDLFSQSPILYSDENNLLTGCIPIQNSAYQSTMVNHFCEILAR